jgi:hypothetical protein
MWGRRRRIKRTDLQRGDLSVPGREVVHAARNAGGGNAAELATYVVEKGKPLLTLAR